MKIVKQPKDEIVNQSVYSQYLEEEGFESMTDRKHLQHTYSVFQSNIDE